MQLTNSYRLLCTAPLNYGEQLAARIEKRHLLVALVLAAPIFTGISQAFAQQANQPGFDPRQPLPADLQGRDVTRGESELKGHIKGAEESDKGSGSAAYVPPEPKDDLQLNYALELLRGQKTDPAFPPNPDKAVMNQQ